MPASTGPAGQPFGFTGREHELDSGLVYARDRYLASSDGRRTQPDRLASRIAAEAPEANRYGLLANNPANAVDPLGLLPFTWPLAGRIGLAAGFTLVGVGLTWSLLGLQAYISRDESDWMLEYGAYMLAMGMVIIEVSRRLSRPCPGAEFEGEIKTPKGPVSFMAVIGVEGSAFVLKDIAIYGIGTQTGLFREMIQLRTTAARLAAAWGFKELRIIATRGASSSSANPGHGMELRMDLRRHNTIISLFRVMLGG